MSNNKFIADSSDIPSDYDLAQAKAQKLQKIMTKERRNKKENQLALSGKTDELDKLHLEDDFELARNNIRKLIETSSEAIQEYFELATSSESPRAVEVLNNMLKTAVDMNKDLIDLHEQRDNAKASKEKANMSDGNMSTNQIGTQNNIMLSPSELIKMLKNEDVNEKTVT